MTLDLPGRFLQSLRRLAVGGDESRIFEPSRNGQALGLAVSGGGDSMAMLHLAVGLGLPLRVVTVDHGLRVGSAAEAADVGRVCAGLGVPHEVLRWHWDERGNLQDAARRGRRALMAEWAQAVGVGAVALAHTQDDVAETFLMRLARGAGVDGLSAMATCWQEAGVVWLRPLLAVSRAELRAHLRNVGVTWVEDPSNDNDRFERVRIRKAMMGLQDLGLTSQRLAEVAGHLAQARHALERAANQAELRVIAPVGNALRLDVVALAVEAAEVQRRVMAAVFRRLVADDYAPRGAAVQDVLARVLAGQPGTLAGVQFQVTRNGSWAYREFSAVAGLTCGADQVWDGRWQMAGHAPDGAELRPLGAGIALCKGWRDIGLPRGALLASPSLWLGETLLAAPHAGFGPGYGVVPLFPVSGRHHSV